MDENVEIFDLKKTNSLEATKNTLWTLNLNTPEDSKMFVALILKFASYFEMILEF